MTTEVAIPPYRSGQLPIGPDLASAPCGRRHVAPVFKPGSSPPSRFGPLQGRGQDTLTNQTLGSPPARIEIRVFAPAPTRVPHGFLEPQSHRTDQGSSKVVIYDVMIRSAKKSQSHHTDQGSSKDDISALRIGGLSFCRNPTVQIRADGASPKGAKAYSPGSERRRSGDPGLRAPFFPKPRRGGSSSEFTTEDIMANRKEVAIPPYRSGQFQDFGQRNKSLLITGSQSHRTDQGSSKRKRWSPIGTGN